MLKGVNMSLMIGPAVPVPVPQSLLNALDSVTVTTSTDGPSGFQLTFHLSSRSPLQTLFLLGGGASIPLVRVIVAVSVPGGRVLEGAASAALEVVAKTKVFSRLPRRGR